MGRRHHQRLSNSRPVQLFGTDANGQTFVRLAHTVDVSAEGVRISGIHLALRVGDIVGLKHGAEKRRYRVAWTGKMGSRTAGEVGLQALEADNHFWGIDLPVGGTDDYQPKSDWTERRQHFRFDCDLGTELRTSPDAPATLLRCTDISRGGCYLETWSTLSAGTEVHLVFKLPAGDFHAVGEVRTSDPAFGMGIRFSDVENTAVFDNFIQELHLRLNHPESEPSQTQPAAPIALTPTPIRNGNPLQHEPRVLLAEDSRFLRSAYALYLRRENLEVITADDGLQALTLARTENPDVIVLDLLMPRMDGVNTLKALKDHPLTGSIPVIVLSGLPSSNESKLLDNGAFAYLPKTQIGPEDLPKHVKRALLCADHSSFTPSPLPSPEPHASA